MSSFATEIIQVPPILGLTLTDELLTVTLTDGRIISVPIAWYPRLFHGSPAERDRWEIAPNQTGIYWPDLDEDISVKNLLLGQPSGESQRSLQAWLDQR
ncbi:DUF2442 domain-containing protein [Limnothrix sp. FACHB-708]|uniref:DUF2442 domain-containing protein n=1 Tax=unclassified Limnothrix TaxID=2632864 RepID=UPI001688682E|nr:MULTISPECIES: DUF2442 domain-containing protein [unclassified Limnothrix]MBD2552730.1 DUF2442 domain-containing protein [Limnothrix sp. FACHB-708]MBD2590000.1 DUF2442 domain-containing protein [Limnothrix sp. FACHB-406]